MRACVPLSLVNSIEHTHTHIFIDTFKHFYLYTRQSMNASGGTLLIQCQVQVKLINLQHKFLANNRMNGSVLL